MAEQLCTHTLAIRSETPLFSPEMIIAPPLPCGDEVPVAAQFLQPRSIKIILDVDFSPEAYIAPPVVARKLIRFDPERA
jgi:hypothetical protein